MKVLTFSTLWPNHEQPLFGLFVKERIKALAKLCELRVVAPVPWVPPVNALGERYYRYSRVPSREIQGDLDVYHPRYVTFPKILKSQDGAFMSMSVRGFIRKMHREFPFDIIDAHWAYPDGYAAGSLARELGVPFTVTVRGDDINVFTQDEGRRGKIIHTLRDADRIFAVCADLRDRVIEYGVQPEKVEVIGNGVDSSKFFPVDRGEARQRLGLPTDRKIILSVGHLCRLKGFHLLISVAEAMARSRDGRRVMLVIVGGDSETGASSSVLSKQIDDAGLQDTVRLAGPKSPDELAYWYSASDVFCLASSREGWPNVVLESLACGTPVVATRVGGIPEIIRSDRVGFLVERSVESFIQGIKRALDESWDRGYIVQYARQFSWENTAKSLYDAFGKII